MILLAALPCLTAAVSCRQPQNNTVRILISAGNSDRLDFAVYGTVRSRSRTLSRGVFRIILQDGALLLYDSQNNRLDSGSALELSPQSQDSFVKLYNPVYGNACYRGDLRIFTDGSGHLRVVETASADDYVRDVVFCCAGSFPEEGVRAITVITKNYTEACRNTDSFCDTADTAYPYAGSVSHPSGLLPVIDRALADRLIPDGSYRYPELRSSNGGRYRIVPSSPDASAVEREDRFDGEYGSASPISSSDSVISLQSLRARAEAGQSCEEILSFYFPYASLVSEGRSVKLSDYADP